MAMLRSRRLAAGSFTAPAQLLDVAPFAAGKDVYTCPSGYRAIIRDIRSSGTNSLSTPTALSWYIKVGALTIYALRGSVAGQTMVSASGLQIVLEPGDKIGVWTGHAVTEYVLSGAELVIPT